MKAAVMCSLVGEGEDYTDLPDKGDQEMVKWLQGCGVGPDTIHHVSTNRSF